MAVTNFVDPPLVTCIVTCYIKVPYLYDAIQSVLSQDYPNLELIVTDDGTPEFPIDEIKTFVEQRKGCNIQKSLVIHHNDNVGTVRNIRDAIDCSKGEYFVNLDGDDILHHKSVISEMVKYMIDNDLDFLGTSKLRCDEQLNEIEVLPSRSEIDAINRLDSPKKQLHAFAVFRFFNISSGTGMAYSRNCVRTMGLFDEEYRNWQDGPSLVSYVCHGKKVPFNPDIIAVKYRGGGVSNAPENNSDSFSYISKDRIRFIELVTIPDRLNPHFFRRRRILFRYYWDTSKRTIERIMAFLRYPEQGLLKRLQKCKNRYLKRG